MPALIPLVPLRGLIGIKLPSFFNYPLILVANRVSFHEDIFLLASSFLDFKNFLVF